MDRIGQLLGNYRLVRVLGQGGFSDVYLGEQVHLNTFAAIKILRTQLAQDNVENFRMEARTLAHLNHPNIVQVLDFGVADLMPYLIMHYAPNGTLRQRHPRGIPVPVNVVVSYVKQTAAALQYAHNQKLIHRDIKPENLLIGEQNQILLSDFGIAVVTASARAADLALNQSSWNPAGTVAYMAPEQIQGKTVPASDQYALAIVVYEWLTGVLPFNGQYMEVVMQQMSASPASLRERVPSLSPHVEQVVLTALNKDPQRRFGRIEAFANALEQATQIDLSTSEPSQAAPPVPGTQHTSHTSEVSTMEAALTGPLGRIALGATKVTIGRATDNTLVLGDSNVSSHHAEIRPDGPYFRLNDLNSTNGTFVNEQRVYAGSPRLLQPGDNIRVGNTVFTFSMSDVMPSHSDGLTERAASPVDNTSYGVGMQNASGQPSYPPPPPQRVSETQIPTYIPPYVQPQYTPPPQAQQSQYTPPPPLQAQQSHYTPTQPPFQVYNPPQGDQQKRSPLLTVILGVIALVIILAGVSGFFIYHQNQVNQTNTNMTATAQTQANANTATASAHAQATQNVNATATAIATSHFAPFTSLALDDSLTNSSDSQWDSNSACMASSNGYNVSIQQFNTLKWCNYASSTFTDFAFQVNMTIKSGDCGGMIFREVDHNNFYAVLVCADATYDLGIFQNGSFQWASALNQRSSSSAIRRGSGQMNTVAIVVQGNTFNLYVNNFTNRVDTFTDSALDQQGAIGLLADNLGNPTSVVYTNAVVWTQ
ncbi:MAG TPA: protein kinase [Ktedonobacteraceae bacterium]|nr:protein kinase [Ktedonobacteraceae bacterium]